MSLLQGIVGRSPALLQAQRRAVALARSVAPVLICGETGTGKELFARAIHYGSDRAGAPFVPVNCGALPEQLVENELFGHERGAYTGADGSQSGLVDEAAGGTLLLDEIDSLPLVAQVKLLRLLQDGEFRRLGSTRTRRVDVRVVAATNAQLATAVAERRFRADLYYRLDILRLDLPPLRERPGDLVVLTEHFLTRFAARYGQSVPTIAEPGMRRLLAHPWPGNVRELEGVLHRAVVLARGGELGEEHLELPSTANGDGTAPPMELREFRDAKDAAIAEFEKCYVSRLLAEHDGNLSAAARTAGQDRRTLQRLLAKHGIDRARFGA